MNKIEQGFKKLAAASEPTSKTNRALLAEAKKAADLVINLTICEAETNETWGVTGAWRRWQLPGNWSIQRRGSDEEALCLVASSGWDDPAVDSSPESARNFGRSVNNGLLIELAKWLEGRHQESTAASKILKAANKALNKIG